MDESKLQRAARVAVRLNEATEELNRQLIRIEIAFRAMQFGVEARVPLDEHENTFLSWEKRGKDWHLAVRYRHDPSEGTILVKASRRTRVLAASNIEALVDVLCNEIIEQTESVEDATNTVIQTAENLER